MITRQKFEDSLTSDTAPADLDPPLLALWWAGKGDWDRAHEVVQAHEGEAAADMVHAHLHRQEGDTGNAQYWYRRAGRRMPTLSLRLEWSALVEEFLTGKTL